MKIDRYYLVLILIIISSSRVCSQVIGVAASKLSAYNAQTLDAKALEFEPSLFLSQSSYCFDNEGNLIQKFASSDSISINLESGFRFTYGAAERIEAGCFIPVDLSSISFSTKFNFLNLTNYSMSGLVGVNFQSLGQVVDQKNRSFSNSPKFAVGMAISHQVNERLSFDGNIHFQSSLNKTIEGHKNDLILVLDAGYFIIPGIQAVAEVLYSRSSFEYTEISNKLLLLNVGATLETSENFILVINTPIPVSGKNCEKTYGLGLALTILFN